MKRLYMRLFLPDTDNPYQQLQATEALDTARRLDIGIDVEFAQGDFSLQVRQIFKATRQDADVPNVVIVMPVQEAALKSLSEATAALGIGWVYLNRDAGNVAALRAANPTVPCALATPDHREIGLVQARQLRTLFPGGAQVLYVQGRVTSSSAEARAAGLREGLAQPGSSIDVVATIDGNWTAKDTGTSMARWLQLMLPARLRVDAIVCQSDFMATGAIEALRATAEALGRPELRWLPVLGCDGLPSVGARLVDQGQLAATVQVPTTTAAAIEGVAAFHRNGTPLPEVIRLRPTAYPSQEVLVERAALSTART